MSEADRPSVITGKAQMMAGISTVQQEAARHLGSSGGIESSWAPAIAALRERNRRCASCEFCQGA